MGFKVTVRKNGAKHGEAHYTSEAVAVGMANKMRNAGADVSVARCNGSACGCGSKSNPRFTSPGYVVIRRSGQQDEFRTLAEAKAAVSRASGGRKTLKWKAVGRDENGEPNDWLCDDVDDEIRKIGAKSNPRRNGTTAGAMAASRSMAYTRLFRNGAAKSETYEQARKRILAEFGAAGWTTSSPSLKVPHATSPDGLTRAWFKPQAIHFTNVGPHQRHELGNAHTVSYSLDIRKVPAGVFVPWFTKNFAK